MLKKNVFSKFLFFLVQNFIFQLPLTKNHWFYELSSIFLENGGGHQKNTKKNKEKMKILKKYFFSALEIY